MVSIFSKSIIFFVFMSCFSITLNLKSPRDSCLHPTRSKAMGWRNLGFPTDVSSQISWMFRLGCVRREVISNTHIYLMFLFDIVIVVGCLY